MLNPKIDTDKFLNELKLFCFRQYNSLKPNIPRFGLSITSLDGLINGDDLESLYQWNKNNNTSYDEMSFKKYTDVFSLSRELQPIFKSFDPFVGRSHVINLKKGGYFPPHRDDWGSKDQQTLRLFLPISMCNPPHMYFMLNDNLLHFNMGYLYFINTNIEHNLFSFSDDCYFIVMNIESNEYTLNKIFSSFYNK